jgi:hypothetical protein
MFFGVAHRQARHTGALSKTPSQVHLTRPLMQEYISLNDI